MAWVKLDDGFPFHRKAILAGKDARALYVTALCWSSGQLTDGLIDAAAVPMLAAVSEVDAEAAVQRLVDVGLWERAGGGYRIHDYHDYNPSADGVRAVRQARAEAGRRGGLASAVSRDETIAPANGQANAQANAAANGQAAERQNPTPSPSPSPDPIPGPGGGGGDPRAAALHGALRAAGRIPTSRMEAEAWTALLEEHEWADAEVLREAVEQGALNRAGNMLRYVGSILARCQKDGTRPGVLAANGRARASPRGSVLQRVDDEIRRFAQGGGADDG